jgi:hypothetical protein
MGGTARAFPDTGNTIDFATGGASGMDGGPITIVAMVLLTDTTNGGVVTAMTTGGGRMWDVEVFAGAYYYTTTAGNFDESPLDPVTGSWHIIGVTKASGSATPRWHRHVWDGSPTWEHSAGGVAIGDASAPGSDGMLRVGRWSSSTEYLNGVVEVIAIWDTALSDGAIEALSASYAAWPAASPLVLWHFDQAAVTTAVDDQSTTGTADQTARTGTSVTTGNADFPDSSGSGATVTPSVIATVATVATSTPAAGSQATPAGVAGIASLPSAGLSASTQATPATLTGVASLPSAGLSASTQATPATLTGVASLPSATVVTAGTITPGVLLGLASTYAPAVAVGSVVAAPTVAVLASVGTVVPTAGTDVPAVLVQGSTLLPPANLASGGSVSVSAALITGRSTIPLPGVITRLNSGSRLWVNSSSSARRVQSWSGGEPGAI